MKKKNSYLKLPSSLSLDYILLTIVLVFSLIYRFVYFGFLNPNILIYNSDSVTYFTSGLIDLYRTPIYPILIKSFEFFSKDHYIENLIFFQQIISFLSIIPFYYCAKKIVKNNYLTVLSTAFYGCWHYLLSYNINLNPESLSIAGSTLVLFLFIKYVEIPNRMTLISIVLLSFVLIMLKPTYLILLLIIFIFLIARIILFRAEKKVLYWGILSWFMAVLGVFGYCEMNSIYNGEFVLSKIALNNSLANVVLSGAYLQGEDKDLIALIDSTKGQNIYTCVFLLNNESSDKYKLSNSKFPSYLPPTKNLIFCSSIPDIENYSSQRLHQFVKKSQYTAKYLNYIIKRFVRVLTTYKILFIFIFSELLFILFAFLKQKKIAWSLVFSIIFVLGQFATIVIGGIEHWGRLLIPSYPMFILITATFFSMIISSLDRDRISKFLL